jgi:hypothetical protein
MEEAAFGECCQLACKNDPLSALKNGPPGRGIKRKAKKH